MLRFIFNSLLILFLLNTPTISSEQTLIAFGSCLKQRHPMPILSAIKRLEPELMLMMGDNVYGAFTGSLPRTVRRAYRRQAGNLAAVGWKTPMEAIWDDGDYGLNDGGADFAHKQKSKDLFLDFWQVPENDRRRKGTGLYHQKIMQTGQGVVQILFLDTRFFKSPWKKDPSNNPIKRYTPDTTAKTMLGEEQWQWLAKALQTHADLRLLVSPIQFLPTGHFWECWSMFPRERQRLMGLLDFLQIKNLIILSGDRHRAAFYKDTTRGGIELIEVTSSALNAPASERDEPGPKRLTELYVKENFGLVRINWRLKTVSLEIRDLNGRMVYQKILDNLL